MPRSQLRLNSDSGTPDRGRDRILRAARQVFIRHGGSAFSARGVAKEAGVSLGAVQHFFRTKDELLAATMEHVLDAYRREYARLEEELPFSAEARLLGVIDILVADVWQQDSRRFFFGLYALSGHNAFAQQLVNDVWAHHQRRLATYIGAARPHLAEQECMDLALQISALIEGLMVYTAPGCKAITPRSRLASIVKHSVRLLLNGRGIAQSAA